MTAEIINGRAIAALLTTKIAQEVATLTRPPGLSVIIVGDDGASHIYVNAKQRKAEELGFKAETIRLSGDTTEEEILTQVARLNARDDVDGILVQLPLPPQINTLRVMAAIDPSKDVDGLHALNAGLLSQGKKGMTPCTPSGCLKLIHSLVPDLTGMNAVVIGASNIVGKPMAALLLSERATVTQCHIHTRDTRFIARAADILVVAAGSPNLVRGDWIKPRAIVIDVGITRIPTEDGKTKMVGDVEFDEAVAVAGAITPVPGGVGPMTIACLMENTLSAARQRS